MDIPHSILRRVLGGFLFSQIAFLSATPGRANDVILPELLSVRDVAVPARVAGNGDSVAPQVSADGRFIVFSSSANDLVTNDNGCFGLDAFLHDRASNTTVLVSANWRGSGGGNGNSVALNVSTNGRFVLFQSDASDLQPNDTNAASDIFVRDLALGTNLLVSVAADGGWANGDSTETVMTPDGRWVAFVSEATNLVADDTNGIPDLFLRDLVNGTTECVTVGATGANAVVSTPCITPDGKHLAFFSSAKGLAEGVPATSTGEIYLFDELSDQRHWVSTNAAATAFALLGLDNAPSYHPALSDDGRYVAFKTGWTNGTVAPTSGGEAAAIVLLYDSLSGSATILSTNAFPPWFNNDDVYGPEISPDGRLIVFVQRESSSATNFASIRLWDRLTGTNSVVSVDVNGASPTGTTSHTPAISDDGHYVMFLSDATNLVSNTVSNGFHIYRRDLLTETNILVDVDMSGVGSEDEFGVIPCLSGDGSVVAFATLDGDLVPSDDNKALDLFAWGSASGTNQLISARDPLALSVSGNSASTLGDMSISADGGLVAFTSFAGDLVTNDFNQEADVFVRNWYSGETWLVSVGLDGNAASGSVGLDGNAASGGGSYSPVLCNDGRHVLFLSTAANLVSGNTDPSPYYNNADVFLRDLATGTTTILSVDTNGVPLGGQGSEDCVSPVISRDARYVAFRIGGYVYWRDLETSIMRVLTNYANASKPISMSVDGQRVAYLSNWGYLYVWDAGWNRNIYSNTGLDLTSASLSPNGNRLIYVDYGHTYQREIPGTANVLLYPISVEIQHASQWSGDGRFLTFVTDSSLVAEDTNGVNDIYLHDFQTSELTLISGNQSGTASANGASDSPILSADGRFVLFRTFASDVVLSLIGSPSWVIYDRVVGTNRWVLSDTTGIVLPGKHRHARLTLSANGEGLAYQRWDEGFISDDLNRAGDAFALVVTTGPVFDSDGDGIPDWWMNQHFGHPTGEPGDLSQAGDDADGDGLNTAEEFNAGTDPRNLLSVLATRIEPDANGQVMATWDAVPGKSYRLLSTTNLANPIWETYPASILLNGYQGSVSLQSTGTTRYFRIETGN